MKLFAKGTRNDSVIPPTVREHCFDVLDMATTILEETHESLAGRFDRNGARALETLLRVAAVLHDVMKSNSAFQQMLTAEADRKTQPVRHEILAAAILTQHQTIRDWFQSQLTVEDYWDLVWAIGGHHFQMRLKRETETVNPMFRDRNVPNRVTLHLGHEQVAEIFAKVRNLLDVDEMFPNLEDMIDLDPIDEES